MKIIAAVVILAIIVVLIILVAIYMYSSSDAPNPDGADTLPGRDETDLFMIENGPLGKCWQVDGDVNKRDPIIINDCDEDNDKQLFNYSGGVIRPKLDDGLVVNRIGSTDADPAKEQKFQLWDSTDRNSSLTFNDNNIEFDDSGYYVHAVGDDSDQIHLWDHANNDNSKWSRQFVDGNKMATGK